MKKSLGQISIILTLILIAAQVNAKILAPKIIRVNFENHSHKKISFNLSFHIKNLYVDILNQTIAAPAQTTTHYQYKLSSKSSALILAAQIADNSPDSPTLWSSTFSAEWDITHLLIDGKKSKIPTDAWDQHTVKNCRISEVDFRVASNHNPEITFRVLNKGLQIIFASDLLWENFPDLQDSIRPSCQYRSSFFMPD
jgi:hypothetical protein